MPTGFASSVTIISICGDGVSEGDEQCDDGNLLPGDGCSIYCELEGDGTEQAGEDGGFDGGVEADAGGEGDAADQIDDDAGAAPADPQEDGATGAMQSAAALCAEPTDACQACNCSMCEPQLQACSGLAGDAAEGPARGTPKAELCASLVRCSVAAGCRSIACVCDAASTVTCLEASTPPDGPCKDEALAAAETRDVLTLLLRASMRDTGYAIAAASAFSTCSANACADACAPESSTEAGLF